MARGENWKNLGGGRIGSSWDRVSSNTEEEEEEDEHDFSIYYVISMTI